MLRVLLTTWSSLLGLPWVSGVYLGLLSFIPSFPPSLVCTSITTLSNPLEEKIQRALEREAEVLEELRELKEGKDGLSQFELVPKLPFPGHVYHFTKHQKNQL